MGVLIPKKTLAYNHDYYIFVHR